MRGGWFAQISPQTYREFFKPRHKAEWHRAKELADVRVLSPGGGFVFQQVHNILADVPPENVVAMFDAVNC